MNTIPYCAFQLPYHQEYWSAIRASEATKAAEMQRAIDDAAAIWQHQPSLWERASAWFRSVGL